MVVEVEAVETIEEGIVAVDAQHVVAGRNILERERAGRVGELAAAFFEHLPSSAAVGRQVEANPSAFILPCGPENERVVAVDEEARRDDASWPP